MKKWLIILLTCTTIGLIIGSIVYMTTKINSGRVSFSSENPNFKIEELFEKLKAIVEKQK